MRGTQTWLRLRGGRAGFQFLRLLWRQTRGRGPQPWQVLESVPESVPAQELEMNKRYVAGSYLISNQLQRSVAGLLAGNWLLGLPPEYIGEYVPRIREVTAEQVQAMGRKYFQPAQQSIVVVGDKAVLEQLSAYGEFTEAN